MNKEEFYQNLKQRFPNNDFVILDFNGASKPIKYKCLKCGRIIEKNRANHLYENKSLCQHCYSTKNSKIRDWIENFFKNNKNFKLIEWDNNTGSKMKILCNSCNKIFYKSPCNIYEKKESTICPICGENGAPITKETFIERMKNNNLIGYEIIYYKSLKQKVVIKHECGYTFSMNGYNFLKSKGCPNCFKTKSKGEIKIEQFLTQNNINFKEQYRIKDNPKLSYDFFLPDYNILIEYQGEQHYFPIEWFGGEKQFERQLFNDEEKEKIAENNNLKLIKISYKDYDIIDNIIHKIIFGSTTNQTV